MLETAPCPPTPTFLPSALQNLLHSLYGFCALEPRPASLYPGQQVSVCPSGDSSFWSGLSWECNPAASTPLGLDPESPGLHILTLFISHRPHHGTGDSSVTPFYYRPLEGKDRHILGFASPEPGPSPEKVHGGIP